jgi:hypothetical protein
MRRRVSCFGSLRSARLDGAAAADVSLARSRPGVPGRRTITRQTALALTAFGYGILNLRSTRVVSCEAFSIYQVRDCGVTAKGRVLFATGETMTADYADHSQESGAAMC